MTSDMLHQAFRNFCFQRLSDHKQPNDFAKSECTFRIKFIKEVLWETESLQVDNDSDYSSLKDVLALIPEFVKESINVSENRALADEAFTKEANNIKQFLSSEESISSESLNIAPFRNVVNSEDKLLLLEKLNDIWAFELGCFFPLDEKPERADLQAFTARDFDKFIGNATLKKLINDVSEENKVFELREDEKHNYLLDSELMDFDYNLSGEGVWFDRSFNWIAYFSHHGTVTFGGTLLQKIKELLRANNQVMRVIERI